ncbi:3-oxoacyl-ACP synthase III family protein [Legionella nagasakiensis]|uniref:3-oxoacyl-ACP synthase III family protein n=1 Tax=Legionella nagasakiensis TaxID=535290 RepID=UPI001055238A|nr:ketoacyl-ACP synthase III [Legionella nagasakiensis]
MNFLPAEKNIYLKGPCAVLPEQVMSNQDIIAWTNSTHDPSLISFSTGIRTRHWVKKEQACSDLAILAVNALFAQKTKEKDKISQLIVATISGDYLSPPTSPLVQHRLGLQHIGAFDIGAACAGFVVGLHTSAALVQATAGSVLLIASEIRSKFLNKKHFASSVLFGDGAAACVVTNDKKEAEFRFIASALFSDGEVGDIVSIPAGGSRMPAACCSNSDELFINIKESTALFVKAVDGMSDCAQAFLRQLNMPAATIDWLIPHQGNRHLVMSVAKQLSIPAEKVVEVVNYSGNTSGASVGIALDHLKQQSELKPGDKILLVAAGGGGIAACALLEAI